MKLRTRLALTVLVTALPVVAGLAWTRARFERHTTEQGLRDFVLARMENGGREMAEASPETFPEPPRRNFGDREDRRREFAERMRAAGEETRPPRPRDPAANRATDRPLDRAPERAGERAIGTPEGPAPANDRPAPRGEADHGPGRPDGEPLFPPEFGPNRGGEGGPGRGLDGPRGRMGFGNPRAMAAGLPPRIELWAYDRAFDSQNPRAPELPEAMRAALTRGDEYVSANWDTEVEVDGTKEPRAGIQLAMRMRWDDGPAAVILARRADRGPQSAVVDLVWSSLALCAVLLGAVLFAAGPMVERVRRLTGEVRDSAATRYARPVEARGRDEITELARAFNTAGQDVRLNLEAVETRERALRTFVENTSHDVMLPLTVLQGHLSTLRKKVDAGAMPERELVHDALEESHYLSSLLQNLAVAARLESGAPVLARAPFDLNALVERAVARQRPIAAQKRIAVEFAVPEDVVWIEGDMTFVEQMLSNVIHNAVRYNHEDGHVAVVLEERGAARERFALRVLDDGPGIPDELRARVVERSFRTDEARSRAPDGMGLGLAIAKDVSDRHGFAFAMRRSSEGGLEVEFEGARWMRSESDAGAPPPNAEGSSDRGAAGSTDPGDERGRAAS